MTVNPILKGLNVKEQYEKIYTFFIDLIGRSPVTATCCRPILSRTGDSAAYATLFPLPGRLCSAGEQQNHGQFPAEGPFPTRPPNQAQAYHRRGRDIHHHEARLQASAFVPTRWFAPHARCC